MQDSKMKLVCFYFRQIQKYNGVFISLRNLRVAKINKDPEKVYNAGTFRGIMKSEYTPVRANWGTLFVFFACIVATSLFATGVHGKNDNIYSMIATTAVVIGISQCMYAGITTLQYMYASALASYHRLVLCLFTAMLSLIETFVPLTAISIDTCSEVTLKTDTIFTQYHWKTQNQERNSKEYLGR